METMATNSDCVREGFAEKVGIWYRSSDKKWVVSTTFISEQYNAESRMAYKIKLFAVIILICKAIRVK